MTSATRNEEGENIKLLTLGDSGVGKSWLLLRWTGDKDKIRKSAKPMPTIGVDFAMRNVIINGKYYKIKVWDTAGQERYQTITNSYYRNAQGVILVYDITNRKRFLDIQKWINQIDLRTSGKLAKILVGNKCDLIRERVVTYVEGEELAREYHMPFYETSALNDVNVTEVFSKISEDISNHTQEIHLVPPQFKKPVKPLASAMSRWCILL